MIEIYKDAPNSFIHLGDCAATMDTWLKQYGEKVDLIYIDPPPSSGFSYKLIQKVGINQGRITHTKHAGESFNDKDYSDVIKEVIFKGKELLKDTGNIFIHCNPRTSSFFRNILDNVFGSSNFVNEIIYKYYHGLNSQHHFSFSHDTILYYRKSSNGYFDPVPTAKARGKIRRNHMKKNTAPDGRVYYSISTSGKEYRYYEDDLIHLGDVWDETGESQANERVKYEDEKSQALLERIIISACPDEGLVCDPFCGTGTAGAAAAGLNRNFIMCDSSRFAVNIAKNRIAQTGRPFCVVFDDADIYSKEPEVRFSHKANKVHLDDYRIKGGAKFYSNNLLPTEDTLVENWSVGRMTDGKYHIDDFDIRTAEKPALGRHLEIKQQAGIPYALTYDVFGNLVLHKLDMPLF